MFFKMKILKHEELFTILKEADKLNSKGESVNRNIIVENSIVNVST